MDDVVGFPDGFADEGGKILLVTARFGLILASLLTDLVMGQFLRGLPRFFWSGGVISGGDVLLQFREDAAEVVDDVVEFPEGFGGEGGGFGEVGAGFGGVILEP